MCTRQEGLPNHRSSVGLVLWPMVCRYRLNLTNPPAQIRPSPQNSRVGNSARVRQTRAKPRAHDPLLAGMRRETNKAAKDEARKVVVMSPHVIVRIALILVCDPKLDAPTPMWADAQRQTRDAIGRIEGRSCRGPRGSGPTMIRNDTSGCGSK